MYTYKINQLPKRTIEIEVNIPKADIEKQEESAFERLLKNLQIAGFRRGKVPKDIGKKHISRQSIYEELIKSLLPPLYEEVVKKENLQPVISPKIELIKAKENEDWQIKITIAQKPLIELGVYKEVIKKLKSEQKKADIWVPGKDKEENKQKLLNSILARLLAEIKFEMSDLIIEDELSRRLTALVDDVQKIGLTVEAYLKSKNMTIDELKKRYKQEIEDTYKLEFVLMEIADCEGIKVEQSDIDKLLAAITDEKEREKARANSYFYASILRKQKTLDFLLSL
jgi:trigger factor